MRTISITFFIVPLLLMVSAYQIANAQALQVIGNGPGGPICMGPLGPGPCAQIANWIQQHSPPPSLQPANPPPAILPYPQVANGPVASPEISITVNANSSPNDVAIACAKAHGQDVAGFVECTGAQVILPQQEQDVLDCAVSSSSNSDFALCAAPSVGIKLTDDQRTVVNCAMQSKGDENSFVSCASSVVGNHLTGDESAVLSCAADSDTTSDFASCAAKSIIGPHLTKEQRVAVECAADSGADYEQFAGCAGSRYLGLNLNPEQQIAVQCVVQTGGQPYAAAGCMVTRLTMRELTKCIENGFGGDGCFGDNNDLVGKNGWVARSFGEIAGGPNSVVNNPSQIFGGPNSVFKNPGQLAGGPNSIFNNPGQIAGGSNSVVNNPGQILGGDNSVFHNPAQLAPPPVNLGTVGGHRVCLPWC